MKKVLFILFLFTYLLSFTQESSNISTGVKLTPLVSIPDNIEKGVDFQISLINGLHPHMVEWISSDTLIKTPNDLIMNINKPGKYILHVRNTPQQTYFINIEK